MKVLKNKNDLDANHPKTDVVQTKNLRPTKNGKQQSSDSVKIINEKMSASDQVSEWIVICDLP